MTGPDDPQYPDPQYPDDAAYQPAASAYGPGYAPAAPAPQRAGLTLQLGERVRRRPEPALGGALGAVGAALILVGVAVWSYYYLLSGLFDSAIFFDGGDGGGTGEPGDSRKLLGVGLALVVLIAGYVLAVSRRSAALNTAGVVASAFAVPMALTFLTIDFTDPGGSSTTTVVAFVSIVVWLISYLFVPGARGHAIYLALSAVALWEFVVTQTSSGGLGPVAAVPVVGIGIAGGGTGSVAAASLVFGLVYYLIAFLLDRSGRAGVAIAFAAAGFPATAVGIAATAPDFTQVGTGVTLVVVGVLLATYGSRAGRRFTTWVWAAGVFGGLGLIIEKIVAQSVVGGAITAIGLGVVTIGCAHVVSIRLAEPVDVVAVPAAPTMAPPA